MSEIKRLHYFDHQFLVEADFTDEQQYHLDMRRRHNRVLHTYGVADGLQVEKTGDKEVTVSPGTAVDREGREIVQTEDHLVDLSNPVAYPPGSDVYVTIEYAEEETDPSTEEETDPSTATGVVGNTRVTERSVVEAVTSAPPGDGSVVRLAHFVLDGSGNVPGSIGDTFDDGLRQTAGARIVAEAVDTGELADGAITNAKIASNTINESRFDPATRGKLVTNGNNHDHSAGDGATIKHSSLDKDDGTNPHGTTAEDVGAISTSGGAISGSLAVQREAGTPRAVLASFEGSEKYFGSLFEYGLFITGSKGAGIVVAESALVNYIDGLTIFLGPVDFAGGKPGYVVERFINRSGATLRTGDVVRLYGTPIVRFRGNLNKIPIPEVALADKENDPTVIGIVDCEAIPNPDEPDTRTAPEDPTSVPDGGELFVVTLGTYAHCKVDAAEAPIEVGDLLTTSSNPGHAKKATDPKIGTIIGKALEPLADGTGYIAVFVNIQ